MSSDTLLAAPAPSAPAPFKDPDFAIRIERVGKCYQVYNRPHDRLKQALFRGTRQFYREFWARRDVDFAVRPGETVGIIGRNGSGKSTLLQILCGTLAPTLGTVQTAGRVAALLELGAGFHPEFTGRENVYLNARIMGLSRQETDARFDSIATFADIGPFLEQPVKTYSSGMYVRLAFSVIANVDADILVIDEALAVGDAFFTQKCMRFLRGFREREHGGTVIFVSHDAAAVLSLCERAVWLDKGKMRQIGAAKAVNESYLAELFGALNRQREASLPPTTPLVAAPIDPAFDAATTLDPLPVVPVHAASESFGQGGARILGVDLRNASGKIVQVAETGERVTLRAHFRALTALASPIVGFYLKDPRGQNLFGQNTAALSPLPSPMAAGQERLACFSFDMPGLQAGHYTLTVAIADGTADQHTQHHWIHDAYVLASSGRGAVATGLVGIPMHHIEFRTPAPTPAEGLDGSR